MQWHKPDKTKRLTFLSMLLAAAFILSWIELAISIPVIIPGIKLGLANIVILFTLCVCGKKEALCLLIGRLILNTLLFGNILSLLYSASGGFLSFFMMCASMSLFKFKPTAASICGGIFHNVGQLTAAGFIMKSMAVWSYLPYLIIGGIIAGTLNGFIVVKVTTCKLFSDTP